MGGEKPDSFRMAIFEKGSPPRGRGKAQRLLSHSDPLGITPAWAGKRLFRTGFATVFKDHPRVGGEKVRRRPRKVWPKGSPPRGRGKGDCIPAEWWKTGITPAWAGKSCRCRRSAVRIWDHPRVGGEKLSWSRLRQNPEGSPPRGRGKVADGLLAGACPGITPALAGKSPASQPWSPPLWMMVIRPRP
mgnify:CR=1 FL=1